MKYRQKGGVPINKIFVDVLYGHNSYRQHLAHPLLDLGTENRQDAFLETCSHG